MTNNLKEVKRILQKHNARNLITNLDDERYFYELDELLKISRSIRKSWAQT